MERFRWFAVAVIVGSTAIQAQEVPPADEPQQPTLADVLLGDVESDLRSSATPTELRPAPSIEPADVSPFGIRKVAGEHIDLWTDLPQAIEIEDLPRVFDLAVDVWQRYFDVPVEKVDGWRVTGYLMADEQKFRQAKLLPADLPPFLHGYQRDHELWVKEQPSAYYRRHLLLHEGVHGFMQAMLGGGGPPWYREGIAELLATHRWSRGKLKVPVMPASRDDVPHWGRLKIIRDEFAAGRGKMIGEIMQLDNKAFLANEAYAWCWAVAAFMDGHPKYRTVFRQLRSRVTENPVLFPRRMQAQLAAQLREFDEQWQLFVVNADYGYDFAAEAVEYGIGLAMTQPEQTLRIAVDRGWQCSGVRLQAGQIYRITAEGQYRVQEKPAVWVSEPGGVTIRYYRRMPLGMLLGAVRLDEPRPGVANLGAPIPLGLRRRIRPEESGTLYLRINDAPGELRDNVGEVVVTVTRLKTP